MRDELLRAIPDLSPADLKEVIKRCQFALEQKEPVDDVSERMFHRALARQMSVPPLPKLLKGRQGKKFRDESKALGEFIVRTFPHANRAERHTAYSFCVDHVARWIGSGGVAVNVQSTLNNIDKISSILDYAFPGYQSNGLMMEPLLRYRD